MVPRLIISVRRIFYKKTSFIWWYYFCQARLRSSFKACVAGGFIFFGANIYFGSERFYEEVIMPTLRYFDPEAVHRYSIQLAKHGLVPQMKLFNDPILVRYENSTWDYISILSNKVSLSTWRTHWYTSEHFIVIYFSIMDKYFVEFVIVAFNCMGSSIQKSDWSSRWLW